VPSPKESGNQIGTFVELARLEAELSEVKAERDALREALEEIANQSARDAQYNYPYRIARRALERPE
jgi:hypothetical protein